MTLKYLIHKEFLQIRRNSFLPRLIFVFPIMIMCVMPWVMNMEVKNIVVDVVDNDRSSLSQQLVHKVEASHYFIFNGQKASYAEALQEVKNGHKRGHWIWYVFPQMKGLGKSEISQFYGINGREEAKAYIEHPILRERLVEISEAVLNNEKSVYDIFGQDAIKVRSCILLFESVSDIPVFKQLKSKYRW